MDYQYGFLVIHVVTCCTRALQVTMELYKAHKHGEEPGTMSDAFTKHWTHPMNILQLHGPNAYASYSENIGLFSLLLRSHNIFLLYISKSSREVTNVYSQKEYVTYNLGNTFHLRNMYCTSRKCEQRAMFTGDKISEEV